MYYFLNHRTLEALSIPYYEVFRFRLSSPQLFTCTMAVMGLFLPYGECFLNLIGKQTKIK